MNDDVLHTMGSNFKYLPKLNDLHLPSNEITDYRLLILSQYLSNLANLSYLDLNYNSLSYDVLNQFSDSLSLLTKLTTLMLMNIEVKNNVNIDRFIDCISRLPHFDYIDLNSIYIYIYSIIISILFI